MNTLERRQFVRGQVIDVAVAKTAINKSRRERADAAKKLRKAMAASRYAATTVETISCISASRLRALQSRSFELTACVDHVIDWSVRQSPLIRFNESPATCGAVACTQCE